jgi:hypothetical protein
MTAAGATSRAGGAMTRLLACYLDRTGRPAFDGRFLDPMPFAHGVARVASPRDGRVGLIDRHGQVLLDGRYDFIGTFVDGVAGSNLGGTLDDGRIVGGRWGLVAADGRVLVEPTYDFCCVPDDGRVTVRAGDLWGMLDLTGAVAVPPRYAYASWHHEGLAVVSLDDADGYIDRDGALAIAPRFEEATVFASGIARAKQGGRWGIIDRTGAWIHEPVYERLGQVKDGACWAVKDGACCVLTAAGAILGEAWFDEIRQVGDEGVWPVRRGEQWGLLRPDGALVALGFASAHAVTGGRARVERDGRWGFVDPQGELVIPCRFQGAWDFDEERAAVQTEAGWTFVDPTGREVGAGGRARGSRYQDGLAPVEVDGRWGFLDREGALAIPATFPWVGYFAEGLAAALVPDGGAVAVVAPGAGVHVLPAGGLTHPVFAGMGPAAHLIAILGFARGLAAGEAQHVRRLVEAWERSVGGAPYTEDKWLSAVNLYVRVEGLAEPRAEVARLVDELVGAGVPVSEMLFARWGRPPGATVMQPNCDPRMGADFEAVFDDFPAFWAAVWDRQGPAPAPENYFYLKGALQDAHGKLCLEERHMTMWFEDVRLCMGVLQGHGEDYLRVDEAAERLHAALRAALERRFAAVWVKPGLERHVPAPMMRNGGPGVEPIEYDGRRGYAFAFACDDLLHWFSAARMRYREPELMEAIRQVVLDPALDLEPVILWSRFQRQLPLLPMGEPTVLVVNLFERQAR